MGVATEPEEFRNVGAGLTATANAAGGENKAPASPKLMKKKKRREGLKKASSTGRGTETAACVGVAHLEISPRPRAHRVPSASESDAKDTAAASPRSSVPVVWSSRTDGRSR